MPKGEDIARQPGSGTEDLQKERESLLNTHRAWKRTQPTEVTSPSLTEGKQIRESSLSPPKDFFQLDRRDADFRHQDLRNANFQEAYLPGADFEGADLRGANFHGANLRSARFHQSHLAWANFSQADLIWADFQQAELTGGPFPPHDPAWGYFCSRPGT